MPPPVLVVEVVSPGKANEERDCRYKRSEYAARGIAGTGVDPEKTQVMVLTLVDGLYEEAVFKGCAQDLVSGTPRTGATTDTNSVYFCTK